MDFFGASRRYGEGLLMPDVPRLLLLLARPNEIPIILLLGGVYLIAARLSPVDASSLQRLCSNN